MTSDDSMACIEISAPGGPEMLRPARRPRPKPERGQVLIRVAAAGINRPDVLQRQGYYPPPPGASDLPGLEVSGTVEECGPGAGSWKAGDQVCALLTGGGYAEYAVAPAGQCLPAPPRLELEAAAALPEACFTVWANVFERGALVAGETLLVHGGAGGIGTTAIQLARALGAQVIATARGAERAAACERLGAERGVDTEAEDFSVVARDRSQGRGVDVILDVLGGESLSRNVECLGHGGRLVVIGLLGGSRGTLPLGPLLQRHLSVSGSTLRQRSVEEKTAIARTLRERVWPLIESGDVAPVIHARFPLAEAAEAHRLLESRSVIGKLLLVTG
jgi:putative PIG3 family NAD(P)H quinone oxidoreductase